MSAAAVKVLVSSLEAYIERQRDQAEARRVGSPGHPAGAAWALDATRR